MKTHKTLKEKVTLVASKYDFSKAKALKAGYLRFPDFAPNILKRKGLLQKAGEYLVENPTLDLTVLIHLLVRNKSHDGNDMVTYREKFILWSWPDEDDRKMLDGFLRLVPEGMCRHTRKEMELKAKYGNNPDPARPEGVYHTNGVCTRTECQLLTTDTLVMTYLNRANDDELRNTRFKDLSGKCKSMKEMVLVDPDDDRLNIEKNQFIVRGIETKTLRYKGNSNGFKSLVFQLVNHTTSVAETFKNNLRPLAFQSKRASVNREFVVRQFAHEDRDTLQSWQVLISECLVVKDYNKILLDTFEDAEKQLARKPEDVVRSKDIRFNHDESRIYDLVLTGVPTSDPGTDFETITGHFYTNLEVKDLFKHLVVVKNEYDRNTGDFTTRFDKYVFGTFGHENGYESFMNLQVFVDPPMTTNAISKHYGYNKQAFLIRAVKEDTVSFENWVAKGMWGPAKYAQDKIFYVRQLVNWLANISVGDVKDFHDDPQVHKEAALFRRKFNLKKSFYSKNNNKEEKLKQFCVAYHSIGEESEFDQDDSMKLSSASYKGDLGQILLKIEENEAVSKRCQTMFVASSYGLDLPKDGRKFLLGEKDFEDLFRDKPGMRKIFLNHLLEPKKLLKPNDAVKEDQFQFQHVEQESDEFKAFSEAAQKIRDHKIEYPIYDAKEPLKFIEEKLFDYLSKDTKEQNRMHLFRYINFLLKDNCPKILDYKSASALRGLLLKIIEVTHTALIESKRMVVIKQGFKIFEKLLRFGNTYEDIPDDKAICDWHNIAAFKFFDVVESLVVVNYSDSFGCSVMEEARQILESVLFEESPKKVVTRITLDLVERLKDILSFMKKEFDYVETKNRVDPDKIEKGKTLLKGLEKKFATLTMQKNNYLISLEHLEKRRSAFKQINNALAQYGNVPIETACDNLSMKNILSQLRIPYTFQKEDGTSVWIDTVFNAGTKKYHTEDGTKFKEGLTYNELCNMKLLLPSGLLMDTVLKETLYAQKSSNSNNGGIDEKEMENFWKANTFNYADAFYCDEEQKSDGFLKYKSGSTANISNIRKFNERLAEDREYFRSENEKLMKMFEDTNRIYTNDYKDSRRAVLALLYRKLNEVLDLFNMIEDEKTKVSFNVTGNALSLYSKEMVEKYTDLGPLWCESIVKDIAAGVRNVKIDRSQTKSKQILKQVENCERFVNNNGLRFFFRPRCDDNANLAEAYEKANENSWPKMCAGNARSESDKRQVKEMFMQNEQTTAVRV